MKKRENKTIFLYDLDSDKYTLSRPIEISIKKYGKKFVASWEEAEIFGSGYTKNEAINDLKYIISRTYDRLEILPILSMKISLNRYVKLCEDQKPSPK